MKGPEALVFANSFLRKDKKATQLAYSDKGLRDVLFEIELTPAQLGDAQRTGGRVSLTLTQAESIRGALNALQGGGRPRSASRCPCGAMTAKRATARGHVCTAGGA